MDLFISVLSGVTATSDGFRFPECSDLVAFQAVLEPKVTQLCLCFGLDVNRAEGATSEQTEGT